ncbi:PepSY domain-containing protein [Pseudomonas entomophila]|uniref:PepSY domain-containing protein n=1 Tax=Pseudomonas entomophila TaxID=312306 RepID=UPI001BCF601F|nr:PepSY domain-containing protein [Pseudomonas entomophila]QVM90636.1 PepSY domain-containing protein [Pseudomonas entomophila]
MRQSLILPILLLASTAAFAAEPKCTSADKATWQDADQFQAKLKDEGYKISKFKVTKGNCYEIYGFDKDGRKVEIYHDPVSGKAVKSEIHK